MQWGSYLFPLLCSPWVAGGMKPSTPLPVLAASRDRVFVFPVREYTTPLPVIGHLAMERERHTVDPPPASPSCQRGWTDLTDLVTSYLFYLYFCFYYLYICDCGFYALHHC